MLKIHPIPAFSDNYIWTLIDASEERACVVDPGDATPVIDYLTANNLALTDILITHHHPDHTGGIAELTQRYSPAVYGPMNERIQGITQRLQEGQRIEVFGLDFSVIEVPGHTLDHIAYFSDSNTTPILFCGDTLFAAGCGRLFEGTPETMLASLEKLAALPAATQVYCTHEYTLANLRFASAVEPDNQDLLVRVQTEQAKRNADKPTLPSNLTLEFATNPFMRCATPSIKAAAEQYAGHAVDTKVEVFAAVRRWKDNF
ncbi:MAG: hydroxyacylglutathione hydrolase [Gammaproteobacteria bacterium]